MNTPTLYRCGCREWPDGRYELGPRCGRVEPPVTPEQARIMHDAGKAVLQDAQSAKEAM